MTFSKKKCLDTPILESRGDDVKRSLSTALRLGQLCISKRKLARNANRFKNDIWLFKNPLSKWMQAVEHKIVVHVHYIHSNYQVSDKYLLQKLETFKNNAEI